MNCKNIQLVCVPYAGGSAGVYSKWAMGFSGSISVVPFELSGRGRRFSEPFYESFDAAVDDLFRFVTNLQSDNIALWGHSMGVLLVFELAHKMLTQGYPAPIHIFVSGRYPPNISSTRKVLHTMPEDEFKEEIAKMGGTPAEVFDNEELWDIFSRILRADYKILETYQFQAKPATLITDLTVLHGKNDTEVNQYGVEGWETFTMGSCHYINFDGGHFFIKDKQQEITRLIRETLTNETD